MGRHAMKPLPAHALRCPVHGIEMTALVGHGFAQRRGCEWTTLVHHCRLCHDEAVARIRVETEAFANACRRRNTMVDAKLVFDQAHNATPHQRPALAKPQFHRPYG